MKINFKINKKYLIYLFFSLSAILFIYNIYLSFSLPLVQDEITTFLVLKLKLSQIIKYFYEGNDTQVPFYFILLKLSSLVLNVKTIVFYKFFTLTISISGLLFLYLIFKELSIKDYFVYLFGLLSITGYYFFYILTFIRPYSLFITLFLISFLIMLKIFKKTKKMYFVILFITLTLLTYTHYFGIEYVTIFVFAIFFYPKLKNKKIRFLIVLAIIPILFWLPAIQNQLFVHKHIIYHNTPNFWNIIFYPKVYFNQLFWIILLVIIPFIFYILRVKKRNLVNYYVVYTLVSFSILPLINYILVILQKSVFSHRYFVPSMFAILILLFISLANFFDHRNKYLISISFLILFFFGIHREKIFIKYRNLYERDIEVFLDAAKNYPVVCETPRLFLPLWYYNKEQTDNKNIYLVVDKNAAESSIKFNSALFDYYGILIFSHNFNIRNIMIWDSFKTKKTKFFLINEKNFGLFETKIKNNISYTYKTEKDSLIFIKRK